MLCKSATAKADPFTQWEMEQEEGHEHAYDASHATPATDETAEDDGDEIHESTFTHEAGPSDS